MHTHGSLLASLEVLGTLINHSSPRLYSHQPYFVLVGIALGMEVIVDNRPIDSQLFLANSEYYQPTLTFGPPGEFIPLIRHLQTQQQDFPGSYKQVFLGSAPISQSFLRKFRAVSAVPAVCLYGMTEALPICAIGLEQKLRFGGEGDILGRPVAGIKCKLEAGELLVCGPQISPHYLGRAVHQWVSTGDLVTIKNGQVILLGRKKDMILRRSYNIYPSLYEPTIESIPGVQACALIGIHDHSLEDEKIVLVVEPEPSKTQLTTNVIRRHLQSGRHSIDEQALPDEIHIACLPRFGRQQKIDRQRLREQY